MTRRRRLTLAIYLVSPLLVFTLLTAFVAAGWVLFKWSASHEQRITNRTSDPIRVTPLLGEKWRVAPHHTNRWCIDPNPQLHHIDIPPGETRPLIVNGYVRMDLGGPVTLVIRTADGRSGFKEVHLEDVAIEDFDSLKMTNPSMLYAADQPPGDINHMPLVVIAAVGVGAPIVLLWLRRARRRASSAVGSGLGCSP